MISDQVRVRNSTSARTSSGGALGRGRADDEAAAGSALRFVHEMAQARALFGGSNLARNACVMQRRHVNQITPGKRDMAGDARALLAERLLGDLHDDFLALLQHFGNQLRTARLRALPVPALAVARAASAIVAASAAIAASATRRFGCCMRARKSPRTVAFQGCCSPAGGGFGRAVFRGERLGFVGGVESEQRFADFGFGVQFAALRAILRILLRRVRLDFGDLVGLGVFVGFVGVGLSFVLSLVRLGIFVRLVGLVVVVGVSKLGLGVGGEFVVFRFVVSGLRDLHFGDVLRMNGGLLRAYLGDNVVVALKGRRYLPRLNAAS